MKKSFKQNVGPLDRIIRFAGGIALLTLGILIAEGAFQVVFIILSIPLFFSGITGYCPTYTLFGISTASPRSQMMPEMLKGCCSTEEKFLSCPTMMKGCSERVNDRSSNTPNPKGQSHENERREP
jgi:hypothetical protein